jgi:GntR family transcriptional regulator
MGMNNKVAGIPLYIKIRESLRDEINTGVLKPGNKIPAEDELAARFGVSRMTVRQGISDLIDDGLLYRRQGVGTFVTQLPVERDHTRLNNFYESAKIKGIEASARVLVAEVIPAKLKVSKQLSLAEGELVVRVKTLRFANGVPVTVHDAFMPYALFPQLLKENFAAHHLWEFIESYGYKVKRAVQKLEARDADEELSQLLEIEIGSPILYKERTVYTDEGLPVEFTYCYNRGDRYSLTVTLYR